MNEHLDLFDRYPKRLKADKDSPTNYIRSSRHYAIRDVARSNQRDTDTLQDRGYVFRLQHEAPPKAGQHARSWSLIPVYELTPGHSLAVPTGLIFVRFNDPIVADKQIDELKQAGYVIADRIDYAPDAVWVRSASGDPANALQNIPDLEAIAGVITVEPQMLMKAYYR
jgi:hypothetical protein